MPVQTGKEAFMRITYDLEVISVLMRLVYMKVKIWESWFDSEFPEYWPILAELNSQTSSVELLHFKINPHGSVSLTKQLSWLQDALHFSMADPVEDLGETKPVLILRVKWLIVELGIHCFILIFCAAVLWQTRNNHRKLLELTIHMYNCHVTVKDDLTHLCINLNSKC